jgi:hypothetical protein
MAATGLPPKVETEIPLTESATSALATVKPIGSPFASPFAELIISGTTSQCFMPNHFDPVRPQPVWTSSRMNSPPRSLTISFKGWRNYAGNPLNWFGNQGGDPSGSRCLNRVLQIPGASQIAIRIGQMKWTPIAVGVVSVNHRRSTHPAQPACRLTGDRHRCETSAVIGIP